MKQIDAIFGFVLVAGLAGLVLTNSAAVSQLAATGFNSVGYLTQVASMRSPGQQLHFTTGKIV